MSTEPGPRPGEPMPTSGRPSAPVTSRESSAAIIAFVLGIFSVVGLWVVGPVAVVVAGRAVRAIDAGLAPPAGRGLAVAGRVLGIIGTVLLALAVAALVVVVVVLRGSPRAP